MDFITNLDAQRAWLHVRVKCEEPIANVNYDVIAPDRLERDRYGVSFRPRRVFRNSVFDFAHNPIGELSRDLSVKTV